MDLHPTTFHTQGWPVFHEDNHLIALYKPAGLLVQGDITGDPNLLDLCRDWLKHRYNKPGRVFLALVHRLDRPVAGVVLFCKTSKAAGRISDQFRKKTVKKTYVAVVEGRVPEKSGHLKSHIKRQGGSSRVLKTAAPDSKEASLWYRVLDRMKNRTLVEIELETGRHHQIRAQLAAKGFPVEGDLRYGARSGLPRRRIALLARQLAITHPTLGDRMVFTSPWPHEWPWPGLGNDNDSPPWDWAKLRLSIQA